MGITPLSSMRPMGVCQPAVLPYPVEHAFFPLSDAMVVVESHSLAFINTVALYEPMVPAPPAERERERERGVRPSQRQREGR